MTIRVVIFTDTDNTLFQSTTSKHFNPLAGHPIFTYTLDLASRLSTELPIIVTELNTTDRYREITGNKGQISELNYSLKLWHALAEIISETSNSITGVLVLHADMPLIQIDTLHQLLNEHGNASNDITLLIDKAKTKKRKKGSQCSFVPFIVSPELLSSTFMETCQISKSGDLNLVQLSELASKHNILTSTVAAADSEELTVIHTRMDFAFASSVVRSRINKKHMLSGVTFVDPSTAYIDHDVKIGHDTVIYPNTTITGATSIGINCQIGPTSVIDDCTIGDRCRVFMSVLESAVMEHDSDIGPFSHLRKGAYVCEHAHIGNYGELKNSTLGPGALMGHFSYLGDATIGAKVNIGAGTITCNFDGKAKHPTKIGDNAFIGSGTLIIAPKEIGSNAKTGAGSVITHDIPANTLAYGVPARQKKKKNESPDNVE